MNLLYPLKCKSKKVVTIGERVGLDRRKRL